MEERTGIVIQLWQLVVGALSLCGGVSFVVMTGALWINSQLAVLADRVQNQTQTIADLSQTNKELFRMWAEHEAHLQVIDSRLNTVERKQP